MREAIVKTRLLKKYPEFEEAVSALALGATPPLPPGGSEKFFISLPLTKLAKNRLLTLACVTDQTAAGVVRNALGLYDFLQKEVGPHDTLFLQGKDGVKTQLKF